MKKRKFESKSDLAINPESVGLVWSCAPMSSEVTDSGIAVIQISGPLEHKTGGWFDSYDLILSRFEGALCDDNVRAVVLQIDSPGGEVAGLQETVRRMIECKEQHGKPVVAFADEECYSAAFALACAADDIYLPESGGCGSVGVLATVCDRTQATRDAGIRIEVIRSGARKAEGHPDIPLSDAVIGRVQKRVDQLAKQFFRLVADTRPISMKDLKALQGSTVFGQKACDIGLATAVASFDEVLEILENQLDASPVSNKLEGIDMTLSELNRKVATALKAVENAKTPAARKTAAAALVRAQALLTEAKVKKTYQKKTIEEETEEDDGEADDSADDSEEEDEEQAAAPPPDDDDDDEDDGEDSKKMKKSKKASASIESLVKSLTGQSSSSAARRVLESMAETANRAKFAEAEAKKLREEADSAKLEKLITEGVAAGQIKPAQVEWARTQSHTSLKAYLAATPAMFVPRELAAVQQHTTVDAAPEATDSDGLTETERKICSITGITGEAYKKQKALGLPKRNN